MNSYPDIAVRARALHDAGASPTCQWSLPLICDHLANAMTGSTGALGPSPAQANSPPAIVRMMGRMLVLRFGFIPGGRPSPARVLPRPDIRWEEAIANLDRAIALCEKHRKTGGPWLAHPLLGFQDARQWQRFHLVHARHHFKCLRTSGGGN
ncbi:MAG TPA: DUF1569 domain-containing protein [Tepidisphaeraceae bacterium]|nr:DUF1569 domain-containing protein [Tepidisphaeraceae bacterium]